MRFFRIMANMAVTLGIDIGGSTTKIVGFEGNRIINPLIVKANDPIASLYGAFGKFLNDNRLSLAAIERIMVTGVGSSYVTERIFGIPTGRIDEFMAIGIGGTYLSGLSKAIIVSMGTGTALVLAADGHYTHIGGSGVGGGTLLGLSNRMLNLRNFDDIIETAKDGNLGNIDLTVGDITRDRLEGLPPETTASNFGNISDLASKADLALGIINLVFQTIGMLAIFATKSNNIHDIVLTGNLTNVPQAQDVFLMLQKLFGVRFLTPRHAEYSTAAGAAVGYLQGTAFKEI